MYLDFVVDIFHEHDLIKLECGKDSFEGEIVKISAELIALKIKNGNIIVKKDEDVTGITSLTRTEFQNTDENSSVDEDVCVNASSIDETNMLSHDTSIGKFDSVDVDEECVTLGNYLEEWNSIDNQKLLFLAKAVKKDLKPNETNRMINGNAHVTETTKRTIVVNGVESPKSIAFTKSIVERKLYDELSCFNVGDILPIVTFAYSNAPDKIILLLSPSTIGEIVDLLICSISEKHYQQTKRLTLFLITKIDNKDAKSALYAIKNMLSTINIQVFPNEKLEKQHAKKLSKIPKDYRGLEKNINELIREGKHHEAIKAIDEALKDKDVEPKYKSSLLLKKAQTFSSIMDYEQAKNAYAELVAYNESINAEPRNLSHLYTELARLQSMFKEDYDDAIISVKKALKYNQKNTFASTLLGQLNAGTIIPSRSVDDVDEKEEDKELMLEFDENTSAVSKMIDIDIKEHKFTNEQIIKNGGKPTSSIASEILQEAKQIKDVDLSERYPVYLEAAKAFSELPIGSYDSQDYLEAVAYYAILKGNSLFVKFKNFIKQGEDDVSLLTRLKDSACSYYIESLNLLSTISSSHLLTILCNYLKMNIALCDLNNGEIVNFSGQFDKVFFNCLNSDNNEYNKIAWSVILEVGTASAGAWNSLCKMRGGIGGLYGIMKREEKRQEIYKVINKIGVSSIRVELKPGEFLKQAFSFRKNRNTAFVNKCNDILKTSFDVHTISVITEKWKEMDVFADLLSATDLESKKNADTVLKILAPYSSRNQIERTKLLIQVQRLLEKQIAFINDNTTFYGRTLFFPLFTKWRMTIQSLLDKKIADTLPLLQVIADPPYIVYLNEKKVVNLIVKNIGESTAEGCMLSSMVSAINDDDNSFSTSREYDGEIPAGSNMEICMNLPQELSFASSVNLSISISAIYQEKQTESKSYSFTLEEEPMSSLKIDDIPWKDGPIPKEQMFKGRKDIIDILVKHYTSFEKDKPYILYGLTRTGKSSILKYLGEALDMKTVRVDNKEFTIAIFSWDLSEASSFGNAQDLWQYLLYDQVYDGLKKYIGDAFMTEYRLSERPRAKDFSSLLDYLQMKRLYPLFLVDEFSFIKVLMDNKTVNPAFLHTLRQFSLEGMASFIYAGTYDIKTLIKDPEYGITGQLVNAVEKQISEIDSRSAEELMNVLGKKLQFTSEAISHIHKLSGDVPYFIQMICKNCGYYAVEKKRTILGYPELETIVKILTGETLGEKESMVKALPENVFQNNMFSPSDPKEVKVLITSIAYFNKENKENPRGVSMVELQELWAKKNIQAFRSKLAEALELLEQKKVLVQYEDDGLPVYKITVDLFRRWWGQHHTDLTREIDTIL